MPARTTVGCGDACVRARSTLDFGPVIALLLFTGVVAGYFPARRAARVDPLTALCVD